MPVLNWLIDKHDVQRLVLNGKNIKGHQFFMLGVDDVLPEEWGGSWVTLDDSLPTLKVTASTSNTTTFSNQHCGQESVLFYLRLVELQECPRKSVAKLDRDNLDRTI